MARFAYLAVTVVSALAALTNVGAAPLRLKRAVTQTAANFKELEYVPCARISTAQMGTNCNYAQLLAIPDLRWNRR